MRAKTHCALQVRMRTHTCTQLHTPHTHLTGAYISQHILLWFEQQMHISTHMIRSTPGHCNIVSAGQAPGQGVPLWLFHPSRVTKCCAFHTLPMPAAGTTQHVLMYQMRLCQLCNRVRLYHLGGRVLLYHLHDRVRLSQRS